MILFLSYGVSMPSGDLPSVGSAHKGDRTSDYYRFTRTGLRRRPFVGYNRALVSKRHDLNVLVVGDVSRRKLSRFDPLAVGVQAAPFAVCDANHQPGRIPERVKVGLLVSGSERERPGIESLSDLSLD